MRNRVKVVATVTAFAAVISACAPADLPEEGLGVTPAPVPPTVEVHDTVALMARPELQIYADRLDPDLGHRPGTTRWHAFDRDLPPEVADGIFATPASLLQEVATALDWEPTGGIGEEGEATSRLLVRNDGAIGMLLRWNVPDDAILGEDVRVRMRRDDAGWRAERLDVRYHCRRGVTEEGLCI